MAKHDPFSRRELRMRFAAWLRANRRLIILIVGAVIGLLVLLAYLLLGIGPRTAWKWYLLGLLHATVAAALYGVMREAFFAHDREAIHHLRGAWGEENTRDELKRAKRKRLIWDWIDSVALQSGDIDHLVVTRGAGLVAIDSKWRNQSDVSDRDAMVRSARKMKMRADAIVRSLLKAERGGHRAPGHSLTVRPVVVVWGSFRASLPSGASVEGVDFIRGEDVCRWLDGLQGEHVTRSASKDLLRRLEAFRTSVQTTARGGD